jgi:hypothetical protein
MSPDVSARVDAMWGELGLGGWGGTRGTRSPGRGTSSPDANGAAPSVPSSPIGAVIAAARELLERARS